MSKDGVRRRDSPVTRQGKIQAAAHAVAIHRCYDGSRELLNCIHQFLTHLGELVGFRSSEGGNFPKIGTSGEESRIAGDDQRQRFALQFSNALCQRQHTRTGQAIGAVLRGEAQNAEPNERFDPKENRKSSALDIYHRSLRHYLSLICCTQGDLQHTAEGIPDYKLLQWLEQARAKSREPTTDSRKPQG